MSNSIEINFKDSIDVGYTAYVNRLPDECPICHYRIETKPIIAFSNKSSKESFDTLQVTFRCPRLKCKMLFISYYRILNLEHRFFGYNSSVPYEKLPRNFSEIIKGISDNFCKIYNESLSAEQEGLLEICGVGYRKSLEFLVKDYLIKNYPAQEEEIKNKFLGKCIDEYVKNDNIKNVAKRATWLGNDETHYLRIWKDKELKDLKALIDLTLHWIEMEENTKAIITDMPAT